MLPAVGYRQWVLSFEGPKAVRLGYDEVLLAKVAERVARAAMQDMRWSVKKRQVRRGGAPAPSSPATPASYERRGPKGSETAKTCCRAQPTVVGFYSEPPWTTMRPSSADHPRTIRDSGTGLAARIVA